MNNFTDIFILALISIALGFKLFSILGQKRDESKTALKTTANKKDFFIPGSQAQTKTIDDIQIEKTSTPEIQIQIFDPSFDKGRFVENAKEAYKIILNSYALGDTHVLSELLNIEMMRKFAYSISTREEKNHKQVLTMSKLEQPSIDSIAVTDGIAEIKIRFVSAVTSFVSDQKNKIISGSKTKTEKFDHIWTFSRNLQYQDPTWTLINISKDFF